MNKKIFSLVLLVIFISCSSRKNEQKLHFDGEYYTIDLDRKKESFYPISSLFNDVRTIVLETKKNCLIGIVDDFQVFDGHIYLLDSKKAKSLFVFDMEGRFIGKIGSLGRGPGEYLEIRDFTIDTENSNIFICDAFNRIHKYQLDGTFISTITIQAPNSNADYIQFYNDRLYSYHLWWENTNDNFMLLESDQNNGKIISRSLPVKYNKGWNQAFRDIHSRNFMSRANNPPRFNLMFMDYIISIGKEITPYIEMKSKYLTTETDIESFRGEAGLIPNISNIFNSSKLFGVCCFIENDDFICFRIGMGISPNFVIIYYKKTGEVKLANYLSNDLIYKKDTKGMFEKFVFADKKGAYSVLNVQYDNLNDFKNAIKNNETVPDLDKSDQLMKLDEESNPVIFFYEFIDAE